MRPPPRVWWDGEDLHVLALPPRVDEWARSIPRGLPKLYRVEDAADLAGYGGPMVELLPVHGVAGLDETTAGRVLASVVLEPHPRHPLWLRRLRCLAGGHTPVGVETPAGDGAGWSFLVCRTCERRLTS